MLLKIPILDFQIELPSTVCYTLGVITATSVAVAAYQQLRTKRHRIRKSLKGKVVVITGGTAGVGKECAKELARHGATVHILARDLKKGEKVVNEIKKSSGNENVFVHLVNLSDFTTVRMFAKKFLATDTRIDILVNNAGLINAKRKVTVDGLEETLQANYLSHFLLTNLLLERVVSSSPSRIINVTSLAYEWIRDFDPRDMNSSKRKYDWFDAYSRTKFEIVVWTRELARKLYGKGVSVNSAHPGNGTWGNARTSIFHGFPIWWPLMFAISPYSISAYMGAQTLLYLATSDEVERVSGQYFYDCRPIALNVRALDEQLACELWWESEQLTARTR